MGSKIRLILLNAMFLPLCVLVTIVFLVVGAPYVTLFSLVLRNRRKTMWLIRRTFSYWGYSIILCAWPFVKVRYVDLAPDEKPPFVMIANHRSASDAFLIALLPCELVQIMNIWPARLPFFGPLAKLAGYLRVREIPFEEFLEKGSKLLSEGVSIVAFPEGTRSGNSNMGPFHSSAFCLAQHTGVKIVPLAIHGNEKIPPRGSGILHPGCITFTKLPALTPEQYEGLSPFKLKSLVHDIIQKRLDSLAAEAGDASA